MLPWYGLVQGQHLVAAELASIANKLVGHLQLQWHLLALRVQQADGQRYENWFLHRLPKCRGRMLLYPERERLGTSIIRCANRQPGCARL